MNEPDTLTMRHILTDQPDPGEKTHVLLWSQSQCALHVESLAGMLSSNRRAYADNRPMDYVPVFFGSDDMCHQIALALRGTMADRQRMRSIPPGRLQHPREI